MSIDFKQQKIVI